MTSLPWGHPRRVGALHPGKGRNCPTRGSLGECKSGRAGVLQPQKRVVKLLTERFGHEITKICGIEPGALTADEANYLIGFRSADEIRYRKAAAAKETTRRLRSKGILGLGQPERLAAFDASFAAHFRRALWRAHRQKLFRS